MASEVGICNSALIKIGAASIVSLTEGTRNATACNEQYAKLRDGLLRAHLWNFAMGRVKLAQLSGTPVSEFDYHYQLPSDWLRTVAVHDNDAGQGTVEYRIEGRTLLSDASEIWLKYIKQVTDPNEMTPDFRETLASMMAMELAVPIAQSNTLKQLMRDEFRSAARSAKSSDALEDYPDEFPVGSWMSERF